VELPGAPEAAPTPRSALPWLSRGVGWIATGAEILVVGAIAVDLAITFLNTVLRFVGSSSLVWSADAASISLNIIAFVGGAAFFRRGGGLAFTFLVDQLTPARRAVVDVLGLWLVLFAAFGALQPLTEYLASVSIRSLPILRVNELFAGVWIVVGFALVVLYAVDKMSALGRRPNLGGGGAAAVCLIVLLLWRWQYPLTMYGIDPAIPMMIAVLLALVAGVSIAFVLAIGGLTFAAITGTITPLAVPNVMAAGISSFILLAVPFFIVAGVLMEVTGMAKRLVDLLDAWVSHWRGGLLLTEIVAMYVFSGMSGSKTADMAVVGSVMREPMRQKGYPPRESVAVLAASGAMGETVPPSIAILILGSITTLSIGSLFAAGLLPAAVLAAALMMGVVIRARIVALPRGDRFSVRRAVVALPPAIPAVMVPVIVIGGIVLGVGTPTEASSFAVVYGLVVAALVYHSLHLKQLWVILRDASLIGGMVLLILATASLLSNAVTLDGIPTLILQLLTHVGGRAGFLTVSIIVLIVLGVVLEGLPALVIFGPLLLPIATKVGIAPLQFGIILIMAMGIGVFAPPVGIGLYQACVIGGSTMSEVIRPSLYYTAFLILGLAVVGAVPAITLTVPHLLNLK